MEKQELKFLTDKAKENYINLENAVIQGEPKPIDIAYFSDYQVELSWETAPDIFTFDIVGVNLPSGPYTAVIPDGSTSVTLEFFASGERNESLVVAFSQFDDNKQLDYQYNNINLDFSLSKYKKGQNPKLYSLDYAIHPNAKYLKIQTKVFGYYNNSKFYLGYMDMNWNRQLEESYAKIDR